MIDFDAPVDIPSVAQLLPCPLSEKQPARMSLIDARWLEERLHLLGERFALPALDAPADSALHDELTLLCERGLGEGAYFACLFVCVARCSTIGRPVAFGTWATSPLMAWCGAETAYEAVEMNTGQPERDLSVSDLAPQGERRDLPRFLTPRRMDEASLSLLAGEVAGSRLECDVLQNGVQRLALSPVDDAAVIAELEVIESRQVRAFVLAQRWSEQTDNNWIEAEDIPSADGAAGALVAADWIQHVPELPSWCHSTNRAVSSVQELWRGWLASAPAPIDCATARALASRAALTWRLAYVAAYCPTAGWLALLASCQAQDLIAVARAARSAGYRLEQPSVNLSQVDWTPVDDPAGLSLRCGLSSVSDLDHVASTIVAERAKAGTYSSLFDIARRVRALCEAPDLLLRLVLAGALDELNARAVLLANWRTIIGWCGSVRENADAATQAPEDPQLVAPALGADQVQVWSRAYGSLLATLDAETTECQPVDGALLPSALLAATPVAGTSMRLAGVITARRAIEHEDALLVLLSVSDGNGTVLALQPEDGASNGENEPGLWTNMAVVSAGSAAQPLFVAPALAFASPPRVVVVQVTSSGERGADLERLLRAQEILERHPGCHPVELYLVQGGRRRRLDTGALASVAWSKALRGEIDDVLGPGSLELQAVDNAS